jgi:hypothetical protein
MCSSCYCCFRPPCTPDRAGRGCAPRLQEVPETPILGLGRRACVSACVPCRICASISSIQVSSWAKHTHEPNAKNGRSVQLVAPAHSPLSAPLSPPAHLADELSSSYVPFILTSYLHKLSSFFLFVRSIDRHNHIERIILIHTTHINDILTHIHTYALSCGSDRDGRGRLQGMSIVRTIVVVNCRSTVRRRQTPRAPSRVLVGGLYTFFSFFTVRLTVVCA